MTKKELRKQVRELKRHYSPKELIDMSQSIVSALTSYIMKKDGINTILLYHSMPDEVFTHEMIELLKDKGKKVLLPTVVGDELELHEYVSNDACHTENTFHIQESDGPLFTAYESIELAIIPGMAFTKKGDRLGRGKGYYDRLLPKIKCPLIGLAFPFQIVDSIDCEEHDVKMDYVVS